jgi:hypothetical protein
MHLLVILIVVGIVFSLFAYGGNGGAWRGYAFPGLAFWVGLLIVLDLLHVITL